MTSQICIHCDDSDGVCVFPYYGTAPHVHIGSVDQGILSTHLLPRDIWGKNFREDPECPGMGTYLRCPYCGAGEPLEQTT